MTDGAGQTRPPISRTLGWAAYLGSSWTWCIGMYLPILMVRDLGLAGYLVFAVPNVVGAAAMGWVLRSPESSRRLVEAHPRACWWFSMVTACYHVFWLTWLGVWAIGAFQGGHWIAAGMAGIAAALALLWPLARAAVLARLAGTAAMLVSLAAMATVLLLPDALWPTIDRRLASLDIGDSALWMLPVSLLGFLLCPYLDLTFHRARQQCPTPGSGRVAFTVGFGVFFALMIIFTLIYAGPMIGFVDGSGGTGVKIASAAAVALALHIGVQWLLTTCIHAQAVNDAHGPSRLARTAPPLLAVAAGFGAAFAAELRLFDMAPGEVIYRIFLSFYGLVFPAYLWLNGIDLKHRGLRRPTERSLRVTAIAIAVALPFYAAGFLLRIEPWLVPGVLVVLGAKLFTGPPDPDRVRARPAPRP
ncbi:MAG: hypothetical protein AAGB48_09025 [Planctomycetota bacterium]